MTELLDAWLVTLFCLGFTGQWEIWSTPIDVWTMLGGPKSSDQIRVSRRASSQRPLPPRSEASMLREATERQVVTVSGGAWAMKWGSGLLPKTSSTYLG